VLKAIKLLILSAALVAMPAAVTAKHDTFDFELPHGVANTLDALNIHLAGPPQGFENPGCDTVVTFPLRGHTDAGKETVAGYAIHAVDKDGVNRLVSIELFDLKTKEKVYGYTNKADYDALKTCHTTKERLGV